MIKALRPHQWTKNLLLFVALIMAHQVFDFDLFLRACIGFACFCSAASSAYMLNDCLDIESDRQHEHKRYRPIASGEVKVRTAVGMSVVLMLIALSGSLLLPRLFSATLIFYIALTLLYSVWLKKLLAIDIIVLSSLYTIRVLAGAAAVQVIISPWLLAFSMFFFLSLACVKRWSELSQLRKSQLEVAKGRAYISDDLDTIGQAGVAAGYLSVLVLALYINSKEVIILYSNPTLIWLICPLLMYWITRLWLLTQRGLVDEDPIVFTLRDYSSYCIGFSALILLYFAV